MNKVVINRCYGGFGLSKKAVKWMRENSSKYNLSKEQLDALNDESCGNLESYFPRHSNILVDCVEALKIKASSGVSQLMVVEIEGDRYKIFDYDGMEEIITPEDDDWNVI